MEYVLGLLVGVIALVLFARWRTRLRAREIAFEVFLPQLVTDQMPDADLEKLSAYIWAHQHELFNDLAVNCALGPYGARIAIEKINYIQALSNSDEVLHELGGLSGEKLLPKLKAYILAVEAHQERT